jgi:hypothetical protein
MTIKLLPQEVYALSVKWNDASNIPKNVPLTRQRLLDQYIEGLTETIARWLETGLLAWQYPSLRQLAFFPVEWLIGTMIEHDSYLDALADLGRALDNISEPFLPAELTVQNDLTDISLSDAYAMAAATAVLQLAHQLSGAEAARPELMSALHDALGLQVRLKRAMTCEVLCRAWNLLFGGGSERVQQLIGKDGARHLKHDFLRALYPLMHSGQNRRTLRKIISDFGMTMADPEAPAVMRWDFERCNTLLNPALDRTRRQPPDNVNVLIERMRKYENALRPRSELVSLP